MKLASAAFKELQQIHQSYVWLLGDQPTKMLLLMYADIAESAFRMCERETLEDISALIELYLKIMVDSITERIKHQDLRNNYLKFSDPFDYYSMIDLYNDAIDHLEHKYPKLTIRRKS